MSQRTSREHFAELLARVERAPERLREILDAAPQALIAFDVHRVIEHANPRAAELLGYEPGGLEGVSTDTLVPARLRQPEAPPMRTSRDLVQVDLPALRRDGSELLVEWRFAAVPRGEGAVFVMEVRDRATLDRAWDELRASEERFRLLVDGVRDHALFLLDPEGRVSTWNTGAERIKGWRADEIIGQHFEVFYTPDERAAGKPRHALERALEQGRSEDLGWRVRKDGTRFWAQAQLTPLRGRAGELRGFAKLTRDLTDRRRAEESERKLVEERLRREAAQAAEQRVRDSEEQLARLQRTTAALSRAATPEQVAHVILDEALPSLGAAGGAIYSLDPGGATMHLTGQRGHPQGSLDAFRTILLESRAPLADAARQRTPRFFDDLAACVAEYPALGATIGAGGFEASAALPLIAYDRLVGVLGVRFRGARAFTESQRATLLTVSDLCAQALERSRLLIAERDVRRAAASQRDQLKTLVDEMPLGVIMVEWPGGRVQLANPQVTRLLRAPAGSRLDELFAWRGFHPDGREYGPDEWPLARALQRGETVVSEEVEVALLDGARVWFTVSAAPVRDALGSVVGGLLLFQDVSERKQVEVALRTARAAAEAANRGKDEFLAMLGHELRNPLAPISTAVQLLKLRGHGNDREHNIIERQVAHLSRLVDDLLDVARVTQGKIQIRPRPTDLSEVIRRAIQTASPLLDQRQHNLELQLPATPLRVSGDPMRLEQVFANLLTNAAKYTMPGGHIAVIAEQHAGEAVVRVRDDGVGIPNALLAHLFKPFTQSPQTLDRAEGGLGLGLALVKGLVSLHGGTVSVSSDGPGRGSEFLVRLPTVEARADEQGERPLSPTNGARVASRTVLVVDDNADAAELLAEALRLRGHRVWVATDGVQALSAVSEAVPEVALLDLGLPVMDGYELARRIQAVHGDAVRLIAVTGYGQDSDRGRSSAAGFEGHLVKPVEIGDVIAAVERRV